MANGSLISQNHPQLACMSFFRIIFLLFLSIPLLEIYLLLKVGSSIGVLPTVVLVVLTAVIGVWLLRLQGFATFMKAQQSLAQGQVPAMEMLEGLMLFIAGALLLTPGFFTDTIGFLFLIPASRVFIAKSVLKKGVTGDAGQFRSSSYYSESKRSGETYESSSTEAIEGEFIAHDDKKQG